MEGKGGGGGGEGGSSVLRYPGGVFLSYFGGCFGGRQRVDIARC